MKMNERLERISTPQRAFALVGVSVHSVEAAVRAARLGADYLQVT